MFTDKVKITIDDVCGWFTVKQFLEAFEMGHMLIYTRLLIFSDFWILHNELQ